MTNTDDSITPAIWDGITRAETLGEHAVRTRVTLLGAANAGDWDTMLLMLDADEQLINVTMPDDRGFDTVLHHVARHNAPPAIAQELIDRGAFRTVRNAAGERPADIAANLAHEELAARLAPLLLHDVAPGDAAALEVQFHAVIDGRAAELIEREQLRLPQIDPLLELASPVMWFAVPGMYGGFKYELAQDGAEPELLSSSWCRVADGSGQDHSITPRASRLICQW